MALDEAVRSLLTRAAQEVSQSSAEWARDQRDSAPDFNPFEFLHTSEMGLSRILAALLDPKGKHGQGPLFLAGLMQAFGRKDGAAPVETANVSCEHGAGDFGRIDIMVDAPDFRLVIENKLRGAIDQDAQMARYQRVASSRKEQASYLLFLTVDGRPPSDRSMGGADTSDLSKSGQLKCWNAHTDLVGWLERCGDQCPLHVKRFCSDLSMFIKRDICRQGVSAMGPLDPTFVADSAEWIKATFQLSAALPDLRQMLAIKLFNQLKKRGYEPLGHFTPAKWSTMTFEFPSTPDFAFCLSFDEKDYRNLACGVVAPAMFPFFGQPTPPHYNTVAAFLRKTIGRGSFNSEGWLIDIKSARNDEFLRVRGDWTFDEDPWIAIQSGELAANVARTYNRFCDLVGQALKGPA